MKHDPALVFIIGDQYNEQINIAVQALSENRDIDEVLVVSEEELRVTTRPLGTNIIIVTPDEDDLASAIYNRVRGDKLLLSEFVLSPCFSEDEELSGEYDTVKTKAWDKPYPPPKGRRKKQRFL